MASVGSCISKQTAALCLKAWQPKERIKRSRHLGETTSTECQVQHGPQKERFSLFLFFSLSE